MSDPNTLRILSLDGGGERGYLSMKFLERFVQLWGADPAALWREFDVIAGTSVGGISALSMAYGLPISEILSFFTAYGPYIFSLGTSLIPPPITSPSPSIRPNSAYKTALVLLDIPFYQSSGSYEEEYGAGLLRHALDDTFGIADLSDLKTNVIIPSYEMDTKTYTLFSNFYFPDFKGQTESIKNVALATSAAPAYLPPLVMNGHTYLDGGIYQNDPSAFGRTLAQMIKPTAQRCCVLSIGTGIGELGFDAGGIAPPDGGTMEIAQSLANIGITSPTSLAMIADSPNVAAFNTIATLYSLFEIAQTGGQESVAKNMYLESTYTLNQFYYYRFQPILDPNLNTELDNTDPSILAYYEEVAEDYFNNDIENISTFLGHLTA